MYMYMSEEEKKKSKSKSKFFNIGHLYCPVPIIISILKYALHHHCHIITPALAELSIGTRKHYKEYIPAGYSRGGGGYSDLVPTGVCR